MMWYLICNVHDYIMRTKDWSQSNVELCNHITEKGNDNCRVSMVSVDHELTMPEIYTLISMYKQKLNAKSHGQHVEVL